MVYLYSSSLEEHLKKYAEEVRLQQKLDEYQALENKITLEEHFNSLTDYQKDVIKKVYLEGYTYNEVANSYNVTRQAVNIVANNGLSKLKNLLDEKTYK
jgi:RNA polymerase sigma factor (sigma-70 family)